MTDEARVQAIQARFNTQVARLVAPTWAYVDELITAHHEALDTLRQEHQQEHDDLLAWEAKVRDVEAEADILRQERDHWKGHFGKEWQRMEIRIARNEHLEARAEAAEAECATLRAQLAVVASEPQTP